MSTPARAVSPTRERMIDAAITLLRRSGLSGAGINEIVRESGAPKGSLYHFFPDGKQQIVTEALTVYSQRVVAFIDASLGGARTPAAKVDALFKAFARRVEQGDFLHSCPAATVCLDLDAGLEPLRVVVAEALDDYLAVIEKHFPQPDRRRARSFAGLLLTAIEGAYIRSRAERSGRPFRDAGAWLAELAGRESH
jgi:TetR/AcrR family transcriptional repressor of lmrAB and yxaGH operons